MRSLKDRLRNKFNVSVAETDHQDVHARAQITVALVTTDHRFAQSVLDKTDRFVQEHAQAVILDVHSELY